MDVLQGLIDPPDPDSGSTAIFDNLPINPEDLPVLAGADYQPLAGAWLQWQNKRNFLAAIFMLGSVVVLFSFIGWSAWAVPAGLLPLVLFVATRTVIGKSFAARQYALRERDITFRKGWVWWSETSVPFNRIQHCEIEQGPIEKLYGLATLEVYTAGKNSSDLSISGLERETAERLKDFILGRIQQDTDEEE